MPLAILSGLAALSVTASAQRNVTGAEKDMHQPIPEAIIIHRPGVPVPADEPSFFVPHAEPSFSVAEVPTQEYSHGDPTAEEQYMLEMINRARANPAADGVRLATTTDPLILSNYKYFKVDTAKVRADFATYPSRPPLAFNAKLITAARRHSNDMAQHDFQGHNGSDNSTFDQRINQAGYTGWTAGGENVSAYATSLFAGHAGFNVDWGNESTYGHRHNVMNFADDDAIYTEIGIAVIHDDNPSTKVGPLIITEDFGNKPGPFIVGVVYNDANKNGFYDVGEGISGVKITPSTGKYYATTSASGGYAIPMTGSSGSVTITASGSALGADRTEQISLDGENVKVDFVVSPLQLPSMVTLTAPISHRVIFSDTAALSWSAATPDVKGYELQIGDDSLMASTRLKDSTITGTSKKMKLQARTNPYYWRVRAKNDAGWGPYSESWQFVLMLTPMPVTLVSPAANATVPSVNVPFTWTKPTGGVATRYWFELGSDQALTQTIISDSSLTDTMKVVSELQAGQTYYWRVRPGNAAGWGLPIVGRLVQVALSGVEDESTTGAISLASAPNPFSGSTSIRFSIARPGDVTLTVLNSLGERVATLLSGHMAADTYEIPWNASGFADGIYYYSLRVGSHVETRKMVLAR
jgi:uncharacterized protein YkwD